MLQRSVRMAGLASLALILSACQFTQTPSSEEPPLARIAAKGEWSLHSLAAPNNLAVLESAPERWISHSS